MHPSRAMIRLGLCSSVAPDATLMELFEVSARRGLPLLELRDLDSHGLSPGTEATVERVAAARAVTDKVEIAGYRSTEDGHDLWLARISKALDAPILLDAPSVVRSRLNRAHGIVKVGGRVAVATRGNGYLADAIEVAKAGTDVAWDVKVSERHVGARVDALLDSIGPRLRQVRLLCRAPEPSGQERHGIGSLMDRLARSGYSCIVVLAPSSDRYRVAWITERTPRRAESGGGSH